MMLPSDAHPMPPSASFDGGDLDCGNGLLLLIRKNLDALDEGQLLEIKSTDTSVEVDLPAWCRLTKNELVSWTKVGKQRSYLVSKGSSRVAARSMTQTEVARPQATILSVEAQSLSAPPVEPLSVMGIGSWPRPRWMLRAVHEFLEGKLSESEFQECADDAVRLVVDQQLRVGADVVTDGEQRRDNYSSFVGARLENVQLIPLVDLLPLVDHPEEFQRQLDTLDIPASVVRHPAVFGKLNRKAPLAVHENAFLRRITSAPVKVSLPGPYLLTRTMYLDCFKERAYASREALADDIVRILREEIAELLQGGASLIQLDEPILTEVVFGTPHHQRTFMCGALSERGETAEELSFAAGLLNRVTQGFPPERLAMHVCRGNWSPDESVALTGGYEHLLPLFHQLEFGTLFLEMCTPRAGDMAILKELPGKVRIGVGVVNPKDPKVESIESVYDHAKLAASFVGLDRIWLNPDCGFATFADNPVTNAETASQKLAVIVEAARRLKHG